MANRIPDRWLNYTSVGKRIDGTRFIAFKVPLNENMNKNVERNARFDGNMLLDKVPNLGIIIDLTNTNRYYDPRFFKKEGVEYVKLMIPGHVTPAQRFVNKFKDIVKTFIQNNRGNDKLIGVHCTHGVNRTGYLICNYMVSKLSVEPKEAIDKFALARGHKIERKNYLEALHQINTTEGESNNKPIIRNAESCANWRRTDDSNIVGPSMMPHPKSSRWSITTNHSEEFRSPPPPPPTSWRSAFNRNDGRTEPLPPTTNSWRSAFNRNDGRTEPLPPTTNRTRIAHRSNNERERQPMRRHADNRRNNQSYIQRCGRANLDFPQMQYRGRSNSHSNDNRSNSSDHPRPYPSPREIAPQRQSTSRHTDSDERRYNSGVDRSNSSYRRT